MSPLRVLVIDGNPEDRETVLKLLLEDPDITIAGICTDGDEVMARLHGERPDVVLFDLQVPGRGGIEIYEALAPVERPAVIFLGGNDELAVRAFEVGAVDYLRKPFSDERFRSAISRAKAWLHRTDSTDIRLRAGEIIERLNRLEGGEGGSQPGLPPRIRFRIGGEYLFATPGEVSWIEASGESIKVRIGEHTHVVREALGDVERRLDATLFVRIHRSFIVNAMCIRKITPARYGSHDVLTLDGTVIRMSRTHREKLKQLLSFNAM